MDKASFIFFSKSQFELPTLSLFYFLVLPCTVSIQIPNFSNFLTRAIVLSSSSKILILTEKGIGRFLTQCSTIL